MTDKKHTNENFIINYKRYVFLSNTALALCNIFSELKDTGFYKNRKKEEQADMKMIEGEFIKLQKACDITESFAITDNEKEISKKNRDVIDGVKAAVAKYNNKIKQEVH